MEEGPPLFGLVVFSPSRDSNTPSPPDHYSLQRSRLFGFVPTVDEKSVTCDDANVVSYVIT